MQFTQAEGQNVTNQPQAPSQAGAKALSKVQLKQASYAEGSAFLAPVQAKGPITIGAHKNAPPAAAPKSGITIGAHKAPPTNAAQTGGGAQQVGSNAPPAGGFVGASPTAAPGHGAAGIMIGGHKQPPQAGEAPGGGAPGQVAGGPPNKPLPPTPGQAGAVGGAQAPPNKPLPPTPGQAGASGVTHGPPNKPPPPTPVVLEQQAQDEDKASFEDVDGNRNFFEDEGKVTHYFKTWVPGAWHQTHPLDWMASRAACQKKGVDEFKMNALIGYTGPGYSPMNRLTRGQMKSKRFTEVFKPYTAAASAAIAALSTREVKHTQRGWRTIPSGDDKIVERLYKREFIDEKGFMSTTDNSEQGFFAGPVSIQIAGKGGVDVKMFSVQPTEGEVLYAPSTHFKVQRFTRNTDVEPDWRRWHQNMQGMAAPKKPWFEVDLEEQ